jgi:Putative beta-barrel porin 2
LNLSQTIEILDGTGLNSATGTGGTFTRTNLDVAGRTAVNIYTTRLGANYSLTGKTFLTASLGYSISDYPSLISSSVLSGDFYVNYTYSPKLSVGLGLAGGYDMVESPSQDQIYEQLNVRASYELTGKVSASFSAGFEFRQVAGSGAEENGSPVFEGSLFYQPFDGTSLALVLSRRTMSSATLGSQDFNNTSAILSARQRFLQRVYVGLSVGYENSTYFSTSIGFSSTRSDDYYFVQTSVDLDLTRFWTIGIFYFYRQSDSTLDTFSFYDNQFGLHTSFTF